MVKENPNKESCKERMKELIRTKHLNRNRVVKRCMREFDGVHKSTFYSWYDEVINEPDIVSWEEERRLDAVSQYQQKHDLVERMFRRNMEQYDKYCDDYEENEDTETLNHALITDPDGTKWRISHWAVDIQNIHEILVVCHAEEGLCMDELIVTWESIKDWPIQLKTEGYRIC